VRSLGNKRYTLPDSEDNILILTAGKTMSGGIT
jgi:hypothetical protein